MWAVAENHPDVSRALIEHGADVHARSKSGFTPLLFAARQGDVESARILLAAGANVNEATPDGMSVLMMASASGQDTFSRFLLDKGANANAAAGNSGLTALHYAAAGRNMLESVKALLAHGANPNARLAQDVRGFDLRDPMGATPFLLAATSGNAGVMRALAAAGADPRLALTDHTTPLMVAAGDSRGRSNYREYTAAEEKGALEAVQVVLEVSPDVIDAANDDGQTALHAAAYIGADAIIRVMVNNGAKMDVKDKFGQTPLSIAANVVTVGLGGNFEMKPRRFRETTVNLLLKSGATRLGASGLQLVEPLPKHLQ
jgi:ankyrin